MKVTGKPVRTSVGLFFIGLAVVAAISILPGAKGAQSPFLYVCILGGLFVGIPAALGIGIVLENRPKRTPDFNSYSGTALYTTQLQRTHGERLLAAVVTKLDVVPV
jgi:hypothetical protein